MKIFDPTMARLERALDVRLLRHNLLAGNVANVDTPGYAPKDVDFQAAMSSVLGGAMGTAGAAPSVAMRETDARHIGGFGAAGDPSMPVRDAGGESPGLDGNKVDLDQTMAALAENGLQYGAGAKAISKKLAILRYVVSDGNG